jgi:cobalamin biosynthetic protein CobC
MDSQQAASDDANELRYHGGNINAARRLFPHAPEPWIDLSTGLNLAPYPVDGIASSAWVRLPEPAEIAALEAVAGAAYGANPSAGIVAASGAQALIQWLPRLFPARRVGVLGMTYGEHEACWRAAGAAVTVVAALSDLAGFDAGVVVNPNNPDGRLSARDDLTKVAADLFRRGGRLIVDEAFMDVMGRQSSLVPLLPVAGAMVLRSFGKVYGLAGLRLGFAAGAPDDCALLRGAIGPWAVSGPAIEIGRRALADDAWLTRTIDRLRQEAVRLKELLQAAGFEIVGGTPLYLLVRHEHASTRFDRLCRAGILARPFQDDSSWLRFGIPQAPAAWARLETALRPIASPAK